MISSKNRFSLEKEVTTPEALLHLARTLLEEAARYVAMFIPIDMKEMNTSRMNEYKETYAEKLLETNPLKKDEIQKFIDIQFKLFGDKKDLFRMVDPLYTRSETSEYSIDTKNAAGYVVPGLMGTKRTKFVSFTELRKGSADLLEFKNASKQDSRPDISILILNALRLIYDDRLQKNHPLITSEISSGIVNVLRFGIKSKLFKNIPTSINIQCDYDPPKIVNNLGEINKDMIFDLIKSVIYKNLIPPNQPFTITNSDTGDTEKYNNIKYIPGTVPLPITAPVPYPVFNANVFVRKTKPSNLKAVSGTVPAPPTVPLPPLANVFKDGLSRLKKPKPDNLDVRPMFMRSDKFRGQGPQRIMFD